MLIYGLNDYYFKVPRVNHEILDDYRNLRIVERIQASRKTSDENYYRCYFFSKDKDKQFDLKNFYRISQIRTILQGILKKSIDLKNMLQFRRVECSNSQKIRGVALEGAFKKVYKVSVKNKACYQKNRSNIVKASKPYMFRKEEHVILIEQDKRTRYLKLFIKRGESNEKVLTNICEGIKKADLMLDANLVKNEKKGSIYLDIFSKNIGEKGSFQIEDKVGELVEELGINNRVEKAQNLEVDINNIKFKSQNNIIKLDKGKVTLYINDRCEEENVKIVIDEHKAFNYLKAFMDDYNELIMKINRYELNNDCLKGIQNFLKLNNKKLNSIGICLEDNFTIKLNESSFLKVVKERESWIGKFLLNNKGLISTIVGFLKKIYENPITILRNKNVYSYNAKCKLHSKTTNHGEFINLWI